MFLHLRLPHMLTPTARIKLSDIRRSLINSIESDSDPTDESQLHTWIRDRTLPDDWVIMQSKRVVDMMEEEKVLFVEVWPAHLQRLCKAYCALGDAENARQYARRAE
jgi:hypothetical protein